MPNDNAQSPSRFAGQIAIVTGAGSGIGRVIAHKLAAEHAVVAVVDRDKDGAERTVAEIGNAGRSASAYPVDITDRSQVDSTVDDVLHQNGRIDMLVNNAAVASDSSFLEITDEEWDLDVGVALRGTFLCIQTVLPSMRERGGGSIVNIGSVNGLTYISQDAYSAAKAALMSLTRGIAVTYGKEGVRCNIVAPGTISTPTWEQRLARDPQILARLARWYPLGRIGTPEDVANAALFLLSADAAWITGASLAVDGGLLAGHLGFAADAEPRADPPPPT